MIQIKAEFLPDPRVQVESRVEQLVIVVILVLPLVDDLVDGGSKANEPTGVEEALPRAHLRVLLCQPPVRPAEALCREEQAAAALDEFLQQLRGAASQNHIIAVYKHDDHVLLVCIFLHFLLEPPDLLASTNCSSHITTSPLLTQTQGPHSVVEEFCRLQKPAVPLCLRGGHGDHQQFLWIDRVAASGLVRSTGTRRRRKQEQG